MRERIPWIDIAKGIGIVFVVIGHNLTHYRIYDINKYIYWFHMPLFFIISGLLHKQDAGQRAFIKSRFMHLMIPYGAFLCLFLLAGAKDYNSRQTINLFLGGAYDVGIWWFVTCLFFTQITAYYILKINKGRMVLYAACILYYIAMKCLCTLLLRPKLDERHRLFVGSNAQQSLKRGHGCLTAVETEDVLIKISCEILWFHPVMCTGEPSFEIRKHPMNVGRHEMSPLRAANNLFVMVVPLHRGFRVTPPTVRANLRSWFHILIQKAADSFFIGILDDGQS
jgi:hypothetical protein